MRNVPQHYGDMISSVRTENHGFLRDQGNVTTLSGQPIRVSLDATESQVDSSENSVINKLQDPANGVLLIYSMTPQKASAQTVSMEAGFDGSYKLAPGH
ncbi:unnamed protein product [Dicrocoelium dendriticum]|nr:unnamed protein product [Dicrocoelium dendriticum]